MAKKEPVVGVGTAVIEPTTLTAHVNVKALFVDNEEHTHEKFEDAVHANFGIAVRNAIHDAVNVIGNDGLPGSVNNRTRMAENYLARAEDFAQIIVDVFEADEKVVQAIVFGLSNALSARQTALSSSSTASVTINKLGESH